MCERYILPSRMERFRRSIPSIGKNLEDKWVLDFAGVHGDKTIAAYVLLLWYIHRQSAEGALFFYAYQNFNCKILRKYRKYLPLSLIKSYCGSKIFIRRNFN